MKKNLEILQEEISDCGACSLLSVIRYYNGNASLENLRINSLTSREGVTAYNLIECAKLYGFDAIGLKIDEIERSHLPYIAHLKINKSLSHFVVVYKIKDKVVTIMDPSCGFKKIQIEEFKNLFTGIIIDLYPKNQIIKYNNKNYIGTFFYHNIKQNKISYLTICILNIVLLLLTLGNSLFTEIFINYHYHVFVIVSFGFLFLIQFVISYFTKIKEYKLVYNIKEDLFIKYFSHLFHLPLKYIHLKDPGELIKRSEDIEMICNVVFTSTITIFFNTLLLFSILLITYKILPILLYILLSFTIITTTFAFILNKKIIKKIIDVIDAQNMYNSNLIDIVSGLTSIKHNNAFNFFKQNLNITFFKSLKLNVNYLKRITFNNLLKNFLISIIELFINAVLIYSIYKEFIQVEHLIIINILISIFINSVNEIQEQIPNLLFMKGIFNKVNNFFLIEEENLKGQKCYSNKIEINNLSFGYNKLKTIINDFSVIINPGEKVILKGESGKGKSTICRLLTREYEYTNGSIKIGSREINTLSLTKLRSFITYSSQYEKLFKGSIRDNILLGMNVDENFFKKVCEICCMERVIENRPLKYDTYLYGGGEELSGGEQQLIILARAIIRNTSIIILDETLSELHDDIENKVLDNIFNNFPETTIIYVSHKNKKNYFKRVIYV